MSGRTAAPTHTASVNSRHPDSVSTRPEQLPAFGAEVTPAPSYSFKLNRGMKGAFGFEIEVHHARTPGDAVQHVRAMLGLALNSMPELQKME